MARKRTPDKVKELNGSYKKDPQRQNKKAPVVKGDIGIAPKHFNEQQVIAWDQIIAEQPVQGVLTSADRIAVEVACILLEKVRAVDFTTADLTQLRLILTEFGMTPASRSKVCAPDAGDDNPWAKLN